MGIHKTNNKICFICETCNKIACHDVIENNQNYYNLIELKQKCNGWVSSYLNDKRLDFCSENCRKSYFDSKHDSTKEVLDDDFNCYEKDDDGLYTNFGIYHLINKYGIEKTLLEKDLNLDEIRNPKLKEMLKRTSENMLELENYLEEVMSKQ